LPAILRLAAKRRAAGGDCPAALPGPNAPYSPVMSSSIACQFSAERVIVIVLTRPEENDRVIRVGVIPVRGFVPARRAGRIPALGENRRASQQEGRDYPHDDRESFASFMCGS
jgi:hypothetical protein